MSDTTTPTPEQVADAAMRLRVLADMPNTALTSSGYEYVAQRRADVLLILSALSTAESEIQQCRETLKLKPSESLAHAVTRLTLQVESAGADSKRLDFLIENADNNIGDEDCRSVVEVEAWFDGDTDRRVVRWSAMGRGFPNGGGYQLGESENGMRDAIDAAMTKERE